MRLHAEVVAIEQISEGHEDLVLRVTCHRCKGMFDARTRSEVETKQHEGGGTEWNRLYTVPAHCGSCKKEISRNESLLRSGLFFAGLDLGFFFWWVNS